MNLSSFDEPVLQINLLGRCEFICRGAVLPLETTKTSALLAYLALQRTPQPRAKLIGLLWGDLPETNARANLRHALWHLRSRFDAAGEPLLLKTDAQTLAFNPQGGYTLDVKEFEGILQNEAALRSQNGQDRQSDANSRYVLLRNALDLYQGDFLDGLNFEDAPAIEEWIIVERERLRALAMQALQQLITYHISWGEYETGIQFARQLLAMEPWQEETHRQLMRLLLLNNQRGAALVQYDNCRRVLAEELAVEPSPETQTLYESIRMSIEGAQRQHSPVTEYHLPPQTTPFVGREDELAKIAELIRNPACRLISFIGPGGIGKTRLAIRAAADLN